MEKLKFEYPELVIVTFDSVDIITASIDDDGGIDLPKEEL